MSSYAFVRPHGELGWLPARGTQGGGAVHVVPESVCRAGHNHVDCVRYGLLQDTAPGRRRGPGGI